MKILLSAYACEPGLGSEPEVGLQTALIASRHHDVWVLTRANHAGKLQAALDAHPSGRRVAVCPVDLGEIPMALKKRFGRVGMYAYYVAWQRRAGHEAHRLHGQVGFDVAHHVTFASYWCPVGIASLDVPFIWGPIGGGVVPPLRLVSEMGIRGLGTSLFRVTLRPIAALSARNARRRAKVIFVQNDSTRNCVAPGSRARIEVMPNALVVANSAPNGERTVKVSREIVVVGRLIPWKAAKLALRCFRDVADSAARLVFLGAGPEEARIRRIVRAWGLEGRVILEGNVSRSAVLGRVRRAAALLHTSLHEEAGLAVAEALAFGTPVVALDHGGPAELLRLWPTVRSDLIAPQGPAGTARQAARALERHLDGSGRPRTSRVVQPKTTYADAILDAYQSAATAI